jgi:hypothetical protein
MSSSGRVEESGSDSGGQKSRITSDPDATPRPKSSLTNLKPKSGVEPALENMTVETETVSSIPQAPLGPPSDRNASGRSDAGIAIRVKASKETIRPRKERKKMARKAPSLNTASCRSPIFLDDGYESFYIPRHHHHHYPAAYIQRVERTKSSPAVPMSLDSVSSIGISDDPEPKASPNASRFYALQVISRMYSSTNLRSREASTRADIFEDRVKNAMDEATSDDSDETFVYESNPPDAQPRRSRHHSRTPSGASVASTAERGVVRSIANALDPQRAVPKTRSMKFASNTSNYGTGDEEVEGLNGTVRARDRNGTSSIHHHHLGRQNRPAAGQPSILDDDNPLFPLSKTRSLTAVGGRGSHAARIAAQQLRNPSGVKRSDGYVSYDLEAEGADDERTPLTGTVRTPRSAARSSRLARYRYNDLRSQPPQRNFLTRFAGCLLILVTVCLLTFGVVCFLFAMSKPLMNVAIVDIKGVIASEQEIMMDLVVQATNPNLVPISVTDLDVNLFARSKYVGSEKWWREHGSIPKDEHDTDGDKDRLLAQVSERRGLMTDRRALTPILPGGPNLIIVDPDIPRSKDPSAGQTMLLGHVVHFDNPLSFDGSFWKREPYFSTGSLRLSKPGNHTEAGGTERWERVLTHDFDLIVRGVIRYGIPLGGRTVSVPVSGESPVKGNGGKDDGKDPGDGDGDDDDDDGDW